MLKKFLFDDRDNLIDALVLACERHLEKALDTYGSASLMVSGGSTPAPLYQELSETDLDWSRIHVALVDERWVEKEHDASNEALIEKNLLINHAKRANFTGMKTPDITAADGCDITENQYQLLPRPFTLGILGMGNDGHTASLFPYAEGLAEALEEENKALVAAIIAQQSEVTGSNTERMTMTLHGLLNCERLILLLTGETKLAVLEKALNEGPVEEMPVRAVLRQSQVPVELYWAP